MTTTPQTLTYSARQPGMTAWAGPGLTLADAIAGVRHARRHGQRQVQVCLDTNSVCDEHIEQDRKSVV